MKMLEFYKWVQKQYIILEFNHCSSDVAPTPDPEQGAGAKNRNKYQSPVLMGNNAYQAFLATKTPVFEPESSPMAVSTTVPPANQPSSNTATAMKRSSYQSPVFMPDPKDASISLTPVMDYDQDEALHMEAFSMAPLSLTSSITRSS